MINADGTVVTLVHFECDGKIACMPGMVEFHRTEYHPNVIRTNEPRAVKCPMCERSTVFREAMCRVK